MFADTIGRFSVMRRDSRHDRSIAAGSRRASDAALRREEEVVERAAAHQLEHGTCRRPVDGEESEPRTIL